LQESTPITSDDTAQTLHDRLALIGGHCIVRALREDATPLPQDDARATYAAKITKAEAVIDWSLSADEICRRVRAYNPVPGAMTALEGGPLKIWAARPLAGERATAGIVLSADANGIIVAAGTGTVQILELQNAGGKRLTAAAFLSGARLQAGARLGN